MQQSKSKILLLVVLWSHIGTCKASQSEAGEGRFLLWGKPLLVFPKSSPTRTQIIFGIGIPLDSPESVTTGWVLKCQFYLPYSVNMLKPHLIEGWNDTRRSLGKREVISEVPEDHYEKYEAKEVKIDMEKLKENEVDDEDEDEEDDEFEDGDDSFWLDEEEVQRFQEADHRFTPTEQDAKEAEGYNAEQSRWITYKALEKVGERYGAGGRPCVLRSICEVAAAEFTFSGGVFAELLHIIFTPSTTKEALSEHNDNEYFRAEQLGREGAPCERIFHECKQSMLDLFTGVHDPVTNSLLTRHGEVLQTMMKHAQ